MSEEWRVIPGFEVYEASNIGNIRKINSWKLIKLQKNGKYYNVCIKPNGKKYTNMGVHRLVCLAFFGFPLSGHHACHNNGDGFDNRIENLRWDSPSGNFKDSIVHGTKRFGENHHSAKLTNKDILTIRSFIPYKGYFQDIANIYKVSKSTIYFIITKRSWKSL